MKLNKLSENKYIRNIVCAYKRYNFENQLCVVTERAQWFRTLVALAEVLDLVPSTHLGAYKHL